MRTQTQKTKQGNLTTQQKINLFINTLVTTLVVCFIIDLAINSFTTTQTKQIDLDTYLTKLEIKANSLLNK